MEACLAVAGSYDRVFNLGDIVGYGASPNETVARSRELGGLFVRGNHDKACSGVSSTDDFNHIAALAAYWTKQKLTPENLEWVKALPQGPIKPEAKYLINPGSIGQPRDGDWRAAFAVFDTSDYKIIFQRVAYDVAGAQKRIYDAGLPDRLATRLSDGR